MEKFITYKPQFGEGVILKAAKMNELVHHAFELPNLLFTGYTNGIISGLAISVEGSHIIVSAGVFCCEGEVYVLHQEVSIAYTPSDEWRYLAICHLDRVVKYDGIDHHFSIGFLEKGPKGSDIELCRFKLQQNAKLRYIYDDFEDMNTEFDTVNLIHAPYASREQVGLHPKILKDFASEMLDLKPEQILDTFFCMQVLGLNTVMNTQEVVRYIEIKTEEKLEQVTTFKLYKKLLGILGHEKAKTKVVKKKAMLQRKILVD